MKALLFVAALALVGCFVPGSGGNWPNDMYDRDVETVLRSMQSGSDHTLNATAVTSELEPYWGKTKTATIAKTVHVGKGYFWIDVETTAGEKHQLAISYLPYMGGVLIEASERAKIE